MTQETAVKVTLYQKFCIFLNWSLKLCGLLLIYHCIALKYGYSTPFKSFELAAFEEKQTDMAYAVMAAQEDILELHKKVKK